MADALVIGFATASLRAATPLLFASTGGVLSERGGIVNIALEGFLLAGAFASIAASSLSGGPISGLAAAALAGALLAAIHAVVTIRFQVDQIVSGVALNLLAVGATRFLLQLEFHSASNSGRVEAASIGLHGAPLIVAALAAPVVAHLLLERTVFGLRLRAVGDHPQAAATAGVSVGLVRAGGVLLSGALAGLGGAWLAFDQHQFVAEMSGGRGFIALAAVIFGGWRPIPAALACVLFGALQALEVELQTKAGLPREWGNLVQMVPYLAVIAILAGAAGRTRAPAALGRIEE